MDGAACRGTDTGLFFPERGDGAVPETIAALCRACPVLVDCRSYAMRRWSEQGIWAGMTHEERKNLKRRERRRAS